jgi:hypothetical protein
VRLADSDSVMKILRGGQFSVVVYKIKARQPGTRERVEKYTGRKK